MNSHECLPAFQTGSQEAGFTVPGLEHVERDSHAGAGAAVRIDCS
jgi:hypothetical protein